MVVKLNSLSRWSPLDNTNSIKFSGTADSERLVRIQFNLESVTTFYVGKDEADADLLCTIGPGQETVEFYAAGDFYVFAEKDAGIVHYRSAVFEPTFSEVVDPIIFTKIANRRHRNPELEEMMYRMQENMERRLAQQAHEFDAALERRRQEEENGRAAETVKSNAPGASAGSGGSAVPEQKPDAEKPGEAPESGVGGEQQGGAGGGQAGGNPPA
ncbi:MULTISPECIES: hypothetical protein [Rhizobium/Agrobacterium group]|uniref:hypothetical protein n=1 Tax=Rhizobium/Agrobacterium group TaxID=227290 RepID=UPI0023012984|nr:MULTISPECIES: hypothetical protein [Rhizobium/Agrobacterium group]MDA5632826.1 hypothetical protein [Agrobacterium sp. ST15.16.024]MDF1888694.1 hypothetical protein [Rhizobium rhizogenes]